MKILILEGIPTSGKSSVIGEIVELIGKNNVRAYGEPETHEPIMDKSGELHIEFFKSLLKDATESNVGLVIFDRFHFTQAIRAKANIGEYSEIEDTLARQNTLVVYLQVDDSEIADRMRLTAESRDKDGVDNFRWSEYFQSKGGTFDSAAKHYAAQQRNKMELLSETKLKSRIFNTTHHGYKAIANQIVDEWYNQA